MKSSSKNSLADPFIFLFLVSVILLVVLIAVLNDGEMILARGYF